MPTDELEQEATGGGAGGLRHVYGPVPSQRLGRSLGVDLVPFKTCTYDCVYCQLGRTTNRTLERREYVAIDSVLEELERKLAGGDRPDYVSLSGSGEPTLNRGIGELIARIKSMTDIPVAVLTNGSLLWMDEVQDALRAADLVLPSLDAGDERRFRQVNRPVAGIAFARMADGLVDFTRRYPGEVWLEVFLLAGVTGTPTEAARLAATARRVAPARIQLNTVRRPPAEMFASALSPARMRALARLFPGPVEILGTGGEGLGGAPVGAGAAAGEILALLSRRPCTARDVAGGLGLHVTEALKHLETLLAAGRLHMEQTGGRAFYTVADSQRGQEPAAPMAEPGSGAAYLESCRAAFWQEVFGLETAYLLRHLAAGEAVLSVGCGPAVIESALAEHGIRVTGLDVSPAALDRAPDRVRTIAARAEEMPLPDRSFDAAIYVASLQFVADYARAIAQTARVLRPGGRLIAMLLRPDSDFIQRKRRDPRSYVRRMRHGDLGAITAAIARHFHIRTEYFLGVAGETAFATDDPAAAVLYVIRGTLRQAGKDAAA